MTATCTIGPDAVSGKRCGKPAVASFTSRDGEHVYHECLEHFHGGPATAVGDVVPVYRYGKRYDAVVTHVGARGATYATFTYDNGTERTVRV